MSLKKCVSVILALILVAVLCVPSFAEDAYPESAHNYADDAYETWTYEVADAPLGVAVTFSEDTYVEPYTSRIFFGDVITIGDILDSLKAVGDYIAIYDLDGDRVGFYSGDELAGATVYVPTAGFEIILCSDSENNYYGFRVTDVRACTEDDFVTVTIHSGISEDYDSEDTLFAGETFNAPYYYDREGLVFAGWACSEHGPVVYEGGDKIANDGKNTELWAVWVRLALGDDEIYDFNNSRSYFNVNGEDKYYIDADDYRSMQINLYKNYGVGPYPSVIVSIVLATYPDWEWQGSCYGMSTTAALQHFGMIDLLSAQDASSLSELEADDELVSAINYYQSQVATSWLTEFKANNPGTANYKAVLSEMYDSVSAGNLVMFTFYSGSAFITNGHTVLLCGAYTNPAGEHVFIAYDVNLPWDYSAFGGYDSRFVASADFSEISYEDSTLGAVHWTDDFTQFTSFDRELENSPVSWYQTLFNHLARVIKLIFTSILTIFK
ncbi:MAG: hypothetical protein K6C36_04435 [Clostridia bacterium]|nr:hypothetical protein [Clostridia bacterium]